MPRPKVDTACIREDMLDTAEALLSESSGRRLVLSDIAARLGKSQSYVHSHFRTKNDLIGAIASRWFASVERAVAKADRMADSPRARLEAQVLATLDAKRSRLNADPQLYRSLLTLAADHPALVKAHTDRLVALMRPPMEELVSPSRAPAACKIFEDATVQFRVPHMIALKPHHATPARARAVIGAVLDALAAQATAT